MQTHCVRTRRLPHEPGLAFSLCRLSLSLSLSLSNSLRRIRQFYVQGHEHAQLHKWWQDPMRELCDLWRQLHSLCKRRIQLLHAAADGGTNALAALSGCASLALTHLPLIFPYKYEKSLCGAGRTQAHPCLTAW